MKHYSTRSLAQFGLHVAVSDDGNTADIYLTSPSAPQSDQDALIKGLKDAGLTPAIITYAQTGMKNIEGVVNPLGENDKVIHLAHIELPVQATMHEDGSPAIVSIPLPPEEQYGLMSKEIGAVLRNFDQKVSVGGYKPGLLGRRIEQVDDFLKNEVFGLSKKARLEVAPETSEPALRQVG